MTGPVSVVRVGVTIAIIGAALFGGIALHDQRVTERALAADRIARRDRDIARRDAGIRARDARIRELLARDSAQQVHERRQTAAFAVERARWDSVLAARRLDTRDFVPIAEVRSIERTAEVALLSCQELNGAKDLRIRSLEATVALHAENRTDLDSNRVAADSTRADIVTLYRPARWRRVFSWVKTNAIAGAIGGAIGAVTYAVVVRP